MESPRSSERVDPVLIPRPTSPDLLRDLGLLPSNWLELPAPVQQKALRDPGPMGRGIIMSRSDAGACELASPVVMPVSDVKRA